MDTSIIDYSNIHFFDLIVDSNHSYSIYNFSNGKSWINGQYNYSNNTYSLVFKLIPKKTGLFFFKQGSDINLQDSDQDFEGKCRNKSSDAKIYMNNRGDNNSHLINECKNEHYKLFLKNKETQYLDFGGYCFRVID